MKIFTVMILVFAVAGCASPQINHIVVDDTKIIEHLDDDENTPKDCQIRNIRAGCHIVIDGEHHVFYSHLASDCVKNHEWAHAKGMKHTAGAMTGSRWVAVVTKAGGGFSQGEVITECR